MGWKSTVAVHEQSTCSRSGELVILCKLHYADVILNLEESKTVFVNVRKCDK